jgi:phage tail sheath gpL-like
VSEIIPQSYLTPGAFAQVNVAMGPGTAAIGSRDIVLVGPKLSTGSYTAGSLYEVQRETDVATGGGNGSPLHRAARRVLRGNRTTRLWVLPVAETSGGSPVAALSTVTISGTVTASGWADVWVCGEQFRYSFGTSDTPTTIAAGLVALVNGATHLPVVASNVAGAFSLTAKLKGVSQNNAIRWRTDVQASTGISFGAAAGYVGSTTPGADGSTTEAANLATALATLDADSGYHVGITACDSTSIGHLVTHLAACAEPLVGLRKVGFVGVNNTKAAAAALATARNYERLHIVWQEASDHDPAELMAGVIAVYGLERNVDPSWNPVGYRKPAFTLNPAFAQSDWPTGAEISDAMSDGLIVIGSDKNGAFIVDGLTTRSKDATGTYDDRRALFSERISVGDALAERCIATYVQRYQGLKLDQDETLADGSINPNQTFNRRAVKPSQVKDMVGEILTQAAADLEIKNLDDSLEALAVEQSSVNTQRLVVRFPFEAIDYARQATFQLDEVSR